VDLLVLILFNIIYFQKINIKDVGIFCKGEISPGGAKILYSFKKLC